MRGEASFRPLERRSTPDGLDARLALARFPSQHGNIMPAKSITFNVGAAPSTGVWKVMRAWVGKLVDPDTGAAKWFTDPLTGFPFWCTPPAKSLWTWMCTSTDACVPFGLEVQFEIAIDGKDETSIQTAIGHVRVDPANLTGHHVVEIALKPCEVRGTSTTFPQLSVNVVDGPALVVPTSGQPTCCSPRAVNVLLVVDVEAALAGEDLSNALYVMDTHHTMVSYCEGGPELTTALVDGDSIVWTVTPIVPGTSVVITSFSGAAVTEQIIRPDGRTQRSFISPFKPSSDDAMGTTYPYDVELGFEGKTMSFPALLKIAPRA